MTNLYRSTIIILVYAFYRNYLLEVVIMVICFVYICEKQHNCFCTSNECVFFVELIKFAM